MLVQYDTQGIELQRSSESAAGAFEFAQTITGARIQSMSEGSDLQLPTLRSARVLSLSRRIEVTPLTTLFDQLIEAGHSQSAAQAAVRNLIGKACGPQAAASADRGLFADTPLTDASRDWLLSALGAYLDAFRDVGLSPSTPGLDWLAKLEQRSEMLAQMCDTARSLFSQAWLDTAMLKIASQMKLPGESSLGSVAAPRQHAAEQVLALIGTRLSALEYPQLLAVVDTNSQRWRGAELDLARQLIEAELVLRAATAKQTSSNIGAQAIGSFYSLDRTGNIVRVLSGQASPSDAKTPMLRFSNLGENDRDVRLSINGFHLEDFDGVLAQILAMPALRNDEPIWRRAWRFVVARRSHYWPVSGGFFLHQPDLFLRSVGSGFCDDVATVLHWLWRGMGYEARVVGLSGHVVPEINVQGRWELYDPDFGVFYLNRAGRVASVQDVADDPSLVTAPEQPILPLSHAAYAPRIAAIYESQDDNFIATFLSEPPAAPLGNVFTIPKGGYLELVGAATYAMPTIEAGFSGNFAPVRLWFPPGYSGTVELPMILVNVEGDARATLIWETVDVPAAGLAQMISTYYGTGPSIGIPQISLDRVGARGATLTMLANPLYYRDPRMLQASLYSNNLAGLIVRSAPL